MQPGENKGNFVQGRGYTSYFKDPKPICACNYYHGCPHPLPEPNPEEARCCYRPLYKRQKGAPPKHRECETCGSYAATRCVKELNALPTLPGVPCTHPGPSEPTMIGWFQCGSCRGFWEQRPMPFEVSQYTFDEYLTELGRRMAKVAPME